MRARWRPALRLKYGDPAAKDARRDRISLGVGPFLPPVPAPDMWSAARVGPVHLVGPLGLVVVTITPAQEQGSPCRIGQYGIAVKERDAMSTDNSRPPRPHYRFLGELPAALHFLRDRKCWVAWDYCWKRRKWTKPPFDPRTGEFASVGEPATWS